MPRTGQFGGACLNNSIASPRRTIIDRFRRMDGPHVGSGGKACPPPPTTGPTSILAPAERSGGFFNIHQMDRFAPIAGQSAPADKDLLPTKSRLHPPTVWKR
jgi:hypothetical protein